MPVGEGMLREQSGKLGQGLLFGGNLLGYWDYFKFDIKGLSVAQLPTECTI